MTIFKQIPSVLAIIGLLFVTACDKERPYDKIKNKNAAGDVQSKSIFDDLTQTGKNLKDPKTGEVFTLSKINELPTSKQYLAVVSSTTTDIDAPVTPFEMGREVRVVMSFSEDNLVAYEIPNQFSENDINFKPFIKIPVTHIDYTCALDANQKCTQKEIEDTEKAWVDKKYFVPSLEETEIIAFDGLYSSFNNYASKCSEELDSRVTSYKVEKDAINITIEKTMKQQFKCVGFAALINPGSVTYRMQQNISLVKLDSLTSENYEPMVYRDDVGGNEFGYFKTVYEELDPANKLCRDCHKEYVSRWNPKNKVIDYHLSVNFNKPENAGLKSATYHAVKTINESFKEAGTDMKIKLHDGTADLIEGDIRKNLIVMVEDPIKRGLLGYGPSITNPMTGEIVHARTVMFPGVMKKYVERAYGEYLETIVRLEQSKIDASGVLGVASEPGPRTAAQQSLVERQVKALGYETETVEVHMDRLHSHSIADDIIANSDIVTDPTSGQGTDNTLVRLLESYFGDEELKTVSLKDELEELSSRNYYPAELFNTNEALGKQLKQIIIDNDYKKWDDLSIEVRQNIVQNLLPITWIPTLIHEIGHNLGLRHNFHGSNDKDNYYSKEELAERGVDRPMEYSSIMDYSYSSANELSIMGKYDIAALRYAYGEEVELTDGSFTPVFVQNLTTGKKEFNEALGSNVKQFKYCSDEGVTLGADCNRFDQGTSYVEIVKNTMENYEDYYKQRNYKGNRYYYSSTGGDLNSIHRMSNMVSKLRTVFELYEAIATGSKEALERDPTQWETNPFLKDVKDATILAGQFLIDIVATPDVHCLIGEKKDGQVVPVTIMQLVRLSKRDSTCELAGEGIREQYVVMGQAGKSFNHIRDQRNPSLYISEIDVKGIWVDKLMALKTLTGRTWNLGNFDNITLNFLSVPELKKPIMDLLTKIVTDKHEGTLVFETSVGQPITVPWKYSLFTDGTHKLAKNFHPVVRMIFGLNRSAPTRFHDLALQIVSNNSSSRDDNDIELGQELWDSLYVGTSLPNGEDKDDFMTHKIGNTTYYAYENNTLARTVMAQIGENQKAEALQKMLEESPDEAAVVQAIIDKRKVQPTAVAPAEATPLEKLAFDIDVETLESSMAGQLLSVTGYHEMILKGLSQRGKSRLDRFLDLVGI